MLLASDPSYTNISFYTRQSDASLTHVDSHIRESSKDGSSKGSSFYWAEVDFRITFEYRKFPLYLKVLKCLFTFKHSILSPQS